MIKFLIPLCVGSFIIGFFFYGGYQKYLAQENVHQLPEKPSSLGENQPEVNVGVTSEETRKEVSLGEKEKAKKNPLDMMFVVQAPEASWSDERFQNACEEASLLMVGRWFTGEKIGDDKKEMLAIMDFEKKIFGHSYDTGASDTDRILHEYFGVTESKVVIVQSLEDMQDLIEKGNILIVPTDGRKLYNPYFTAPGPETHMLVVLAYDSKNKEYIVHDPGTKRGAVYHYKEKVLYDAIADYPSGKKHTERKSTIKKIIKVPYFDNL